MFVKWLTGTTYSFTAHAKDLYLTPRDILRDKMQEAEFMITCTSYNRQYLETVGGDLTPVHLIYHGLDIGRFTIQLDESRQDMPVPDTTFAKRAKAMDLHKSARKYARALVAQWTQLVRRVPSGKCLLVITHGGYIDDSAVACLPAAGALRGLLVTSGKPVFIAGADVTEFVPLFHKSEEEIAAFLRQGQATFSLLEDLEAPSVAAINGAALGGGFELCLATSYRVASSEAKVGLPETKLGIFPGWGGTVRLPRVAGADTAIEWIASGEAYAAADALKAGAVDAVAAPSDLREAALATLKQAGDGRLDWRARREEKKAPLRLDKVEAGMVFIGGKAFVGAKAGPHYPAPVAAIESIERGAGRTRDEALAIEAELCAKVAKTETARSLVAVFLGDQAVKRIAKKHAKAARPVKRAAVLGAGIMGGGISYQSASRGVPVLIGENGTIA